MELRYVIILFFIWEVKLCGHEFKISMSVSSALEFDTRIPVKQALSSITYSV